MTDSTAPKENDLRLLNKDDAQARVDRITAFRQELAQLEQEKILRLSDDDRREVASYHDKLLNHLLHRFDVDTTRAQKQMSWGMRIISFLGAAAISAAVFFFFYRFWGLLAVPAHPARGRHYIPDKLSLSDGRDLERVLLARVR